MKRNGPNEVFASEVKRTEFDDPEIKQAMKEELDKWQKFEAYEIIEDLDEIKDKIDSRWIVTRKEKHDGLKVAVKARLCLRGYKEVEKPRSDLPTADRLSTKIFYAVCANQPGT